jgi:hypothetical protein
MHINETVEKLAAIFDEANEFVNNNDYYELIFKAEAKYSVGIYSSKPDVALRVFSSYLLPGRVAICGGPVLPNTSTICRIFPGGFPTHLLFFGDLAPFDIALYIILKYYLEIKVSYIGLNDSLIPKNYHLGHGLLGISTLESRLLEVIVDAASLDQLSHLLGIRCFNILREQKKLEMVAIANPSRSCSAYLQIQIAAVISQLLDDNGRSTPESD